MNPQEEHLTIKKSARVYSVGEPETAEDIWIVCHGYGQLAGDFIRLFEKIASRGRRIVAPEGLHRFYIDPPPMAASKRRVGATWMTREDRNADISDNIAYLDAVAAHVGSERGTTLRVLGFSQGCATVFRWAMLGDTRIDELILWSGEVPDDVDMKRAAERLSHTKVIVVSGARDEQVSAKATERQIASLRSAGITVAQYEHDGGHRLDSHLLNVIANQV